ncbi:DUF4304 domain-containing protein [Neobacillus cucumis]|uniref:DUF4304 domain-containing protein n=1 Tax=Neobacillus cucumis TaxID=1740721 RepID=UPI00203DA935|nr:DUF4304 domain-containing protein [Neobacillus cucumis]MCM3729783.1 DUF4304 domain-containing protein [Neobacillus cucumis]
MIGSPEINKVIRKILSPILKENGFNKVNTRNNWCWMDQCIWVLEIGAVGKHFSDVTGWSPMSIQIGLGIYYVFVPPEEGEMKKGTNGELLPRQHQCHLQEQLYCKLDQSNYINHFDNPAERNRNDIWWVEQDGSNIDEVILDISKSFIDDGLKWYKNNTDLETAFVNIENQHNGYNKYYKAKYFAEHLRHNTKLDMYNDLFEQEKKRIDALFK